MIRIPISAEAFEAMARTLPLGSVGYENEINERGSSGRPSASAIGTRFDAQSRPIFYSLPQRRCYARRGVDRLASRDAGLHSRFHVPSVQHGCAAMPVPSVTGDQASALAP